MFTNSKIKNIRTVCLFVFTFLLLTSFTENNNSIISYNLFKIGRSKDANEVIFDINVTKENYLYVHGPVTIYWIKYTNNNRKEPLTWVQRNYAYGIEYTFISKNYAEFHFVSYKKRKLIIKKDTDGKFKVFSTINGQEAIVNYIFIQIDGGTFWLPKITKVEVQGESINTRQKIIEIIKP
ncbi:MAG: hypothetical protein KatS3mg027_0765 [Bacteroidia bacterium]|nr:MAG: hypothetical protein KatS3mg027_0765 [Bacteroidia bacterium]